MDGYLCETATNVVRPPTGGRGWWAGEGRGGEGVGGRREEGAGEGEGGGDSHSGNKRDFDIHIDFPHKGIFAAYFQK